MAQCHFGIIIAGMDSSNYLALFQKGSTLPVQIDFLCIILITSTTLLGLITNRKNIELSLCAI